MRPTRVLAVVAVAFVVTSAACGTEHRDAASTGTPQAAQYPMQIATIAGTVTIPSKPGRIVSLSASATQMVFAVGAGPQVVAVDQYSTYPPSAPRTKLSGFQPNVEAIEGYRPDLVVIDSDQGGLVKAMSALHVPVLVLPTAKDLGASYDQIDELGRVTGHQDGARSVVSSMRSSIAGKFLIGRQNA